MIFALSFFLGNECSTGLENSDITNRIKFNLNDIEYFVNQPHFTENDYTNLLNIIDETAEILPAFFGDIKSRRILVETITCQYSLNNAINNVIELGYFPNGLTNQKNQNAHTTDIIR